MQDSTTRSTLNKAWHFLRQANMCGLEDPEGFVTNLEAAIQFGRNVTWRLQSEFHAIAGFADWYADLQETMRKEPLLALFQDLRTRITKRAENPIVKDTSVTIAAGALVMSGLVVEPRRAKSWYQRSPRIIWQDLLRRIWRPIDRLRLRINLRFESWRARRRAGHTSMRQEYYFDHPQWKQRPCRELVREYLERLDAIVSEAEAQFGRGHPSA